MSLLMEALKKAEEAKRRAAGESSTANSPSPQKSELTLEPLTASGSPLPDLAKHIDAVDAELAAVTSDKPTRPQASRSASSGRDHGRLEADARAAAQNVFATKQSPATHNSLWVILGLGLIAALCLGGYFWWQLQKASGGSLALTTPPATPRTTANVLPPRAAFAA